MYEGQPIFMAESTPHPKRPPGLVHPHDAHHFFPVDGRAEIERTLRHADTVAHHFHAVSGYGGDVCRGLRTTSSFGPQLELLPARLVIHRQTSAHAQSEKTLEVQPRSGILALFFILQRLAADNG